MNILNKLRKPSLSIILASLVLFYSCNKEGLSVEDETQHINLTEFVNTNLSNNNHDARVSSVTLFELEDYSKYKANVNNLSKNNNDLNLAPYSIEMNLEDRVFYLHAFPISETNASVFIESEDGEFNEIVELNLGQYNELTNDAELVWTLNSGESSRSSCTGGAQVVVAIGGVIAFAGNFGCVPCPFIGGGFIAVGSAALILCFILNLD